MSLESLVRSWQKSEKRLSDLMEYSSLPAPLDAEKTTTLYSALREINHNKYKILTAEDPVEYQLDGLIQVNDKSR